MISFSNEQVKTFIVGMAIFTIFYIILLIKKRKEDLKLICIILGIRSCIAYAVCFIFVATGVSILEYMIKTDTFHIVGLFIVLVWFFIVFKGITIILKQDFKIKDEIINNRLKKKRNKKLSKIMEKIVSIIIIYGAASIFLIFMSLTFWAAYDSRDNIVQSIILIIVGIIFGTPGIIIILKNVQNIIRRKDKK